MKKENNHEVYAWRNQSDGTVNSSILKLKSHYVSFDDYVTTSHIEFKVVEGSNKNKGGIGALYRRALNVIFEQSIKLPG